MAHITPSVSTNVLTYRLGTDKHSVRVGSSEWWEWLQDEENTTFRFSHPPGSFTARRERLRGGWYWYAYRKREGRLHKAYLGKAEELTAEHLSEVAATLAAVSVPVEHESDIANPALVHTVPLLQPPGGAGTGHRDASLLTTKWFIPPPTSTLVARPRLIAQLTAGVRHPLTLVTAPAGWGKTSLLSAWYADSSRNASVAWVSLDTLDNDPIRFWTYVIAALNRVLAGVGETSLALLHSLQLPSVETVLTALVNALTTASSEIVLILDDYHVIDTQPIHQGLTYLVDHLPPQVHLVIATRSDPPLPLPRLLVRGHLMELRATDLRFTAEEAATFLTKGMGLSLTAAQVEILEARTEGWIAGLCLAALAMRNRADIVGFLATFTGSNRYIVDYLVEEVLQRQPEEVQSFLLQTSILDRLSGSLCDALREMEGSQALLEQLEHANVFLIPLDDKRGWYRYHHLFADALRSRFQQMHPRLIADLHCRASAWYEQQRFLEEAVNHALAATAYVRAARLIEQAAQPALVDSGTFTTLLRWMEALPKDQVRAHPHLCLVYAWSLLASGTNNWEAVELWLQEALRGAPADDQAARALAGEVAALRSMVAAYQENSVRTIEMSRQALSLLPPEHWLYGLMPMSLGAASLSLGDVRTATKVLTQSVIACQAQDAWQLTLVAKSLLADAQLMQGQLRQAEALYQDVLQHASTTTFPLRGPLLAHGGMGQLLCERNDLDAALVHIEAGITLYQQLHGPVRTALAVYVPLARVQQAQRDPDAAHATLKHLARIADASYSAALVAALRARLHLAQGNIDAVVRWAKDSGISIDDAHAGLPQPVPREVEYLTLARLVSMQGRPDAAICLLERLLQAATAAGRIGRMMEILVLQALMYQADGKTAHAIAALGHALALTEPEGYIRLFADEGMPMVALLHRAYERSIHPHYVATLLAACREQARTDPQRHTSSPSPLVEPLTEREREVLQLLAEGPSNQAIAQRLIVTVGTVKRHVNSICGKLGATNRTQAIARARSFGLL